MANTITITEADYEAINGYLENVAYDASNYGEYGSFCTEEGELHLENGLELCLEGDHHCESICIDRGTYYVPPCYRDDVNLTIKSACAYDEDGNAYPVTLDDKKLKTFYEF